MLTSLALSIFLLSAQGRAPKPSDKEVPQAKPPRAKPPQAKPKSAPAGPAQRGPSVEKLKDNIHGMRMNLLLGGENVRKAETGALDFYHRKIQDIERQMDTVAADLTEKKGEYDVALGRVLAADSAAARKAAAQEASRLRGQIASLKGETTDLEKRRGQFLKAIDLVKDRDRQRQRLAAQLESSGGPPLLTAPLPGIGLAPEHVEDTRSLLSEPGLVEDLLRRDPERARAILFDLNPEEYWRRWPLRPPSDLLREAMSFPIPDLPGRR